MTPEQKARISIDKKLEQSGWTVQDVKKLNPTASLGVAVREFPTDTNYTSDNNPDILYHKIVNISTRITDSLRL